MIQFGEINSISAALVKKIPPLKVGQSAEYRLLNIVPDPENPGMWKIPSMVIIPSRITVLDGDEIRDIAYITKLVSKPTKDGRIEEPQMPEIAFTREQAGRIILNGDNPADRLLHEYLFLCPFNESSPCKGAEVARFKYIDARAEAEAELNLLDEEMRAMSFISGLTPSKGVFDYALILSGVDTNDEKVARATLARHAKENPKLFFDVVESIDSKIKVLFLRAMKENIIMYDAKMGQIKWSTGTRDSICSISTVVKDLPGAFLIWARASAANMEVVQTIETMLQKILNKKEK